MSIFDSVGEETVGILAAPPTYIITRHRPAVYLAADMVCLIATVLTILEISANHSASLAAGQRDAE